MLWENERGSRYADDDFMTQMRMNMHVKYYFYYTNMMFDKIHEKYTEKKTLTHTHTHAYTNIKMRMFYIICFIDIK